MTDGDLLLAAIIADPADDTARLVYADWLQEQGEGARAEFIRVQVELDRAHFMRNRHGDRNIWPEPWMSLRKRERSLWHDLLWKSAAFSLPWHASRSIKGTRRGFIESVTCSAADWLAHGDAIRARHPVTKVVLTGCDDWDAFLIDNDFSVLHRDGKSVWSSSKWPRVEFELPPLNRPEELHGEAPHWR